MPRICSQCNQEVDEKAKFCSNCGCGQITETNDVGGNGVPSTETSVQPAAVVANPNPSATNVSVATTPVVDGQTANIQPTVTPIDSAQVASVVTAQPVNTGVVEFPVGQQQNATSSQLQSMPDIPSTAPAVVTTPNPSHTPMMNPGVIPNNNGVIDNSSFGGVAPTRSKHKKRGINNNMMWVLLGTGGIVILLLLVLIIILLFSSKFGGNTQNPGNGKEEDTIRIGNGSFGYLSVPKNWNVFIDENAQNTIQYTDGAGWIVTLFATSNSVIASKNWATNVANQMQNDGAQDVAMGEDSVNSYHGYKVFGYYENTNTFLAAWFFEAEDGNTHYIAIEGPNRYDDNYDIIYSFSLKQ